MRVVLLTSLVILTASCSEENPERKCIEPSSALADISSLSNIVNNGKVAGRPGCIVYSGAQIQSCQYESQTTYFFTNASSSEAVCGFIVYDCHGEEIINRGGNAEAWDAFERDRTDVELLWEKP
jgi:hypothetical protein